MILLESAMVDLPYLVLLQGNLTRVGPLNFARDTHLIDEFILLLSVLEFIFCNGGLHTG